MYTTSKGINHIHPFLQGIPHILDDTPTFEQFMLSLRHQPLHVVSRFDIQSFLSFEKLLKLILLQQVPCITYENPFEVHNEISQCSVVMHISRGKENALQSPPSSTYPMQFGPEEPPLRCLSTSSYLFCYTIFIYIMVLAYRYIRRIYKMFLVASAVQFQQVLHQQADEYSRTIRSL